MEAIIIGAQRRSKYSRLAPLGKPLTEAVRSPPDGQGHRPPLRSALVCPSLPSLALPRAKGVQPYSTTLPTIYSHR